MTIDIAFGRRSRSRSSSRRTTAARRRSRNVSWVSFAIVAGILVCATLGLTPGSVLDDLPDLSDLTDLTDITDAPGAIVAGGVEVTDGDTIRIQGERIRIENIDTPELGSGAECLAERRLADRALEHAAQLFAQGGEIRVARNGQDQYGRTLARLSIDGQDFGRAMVSAGYAESWTGRRVDWCAAA
jgi:endonuclease YncB( thermonuclease family)